ncbi:MAG: hypothetical protein R2765_05595 [Ferruginibacter sp.]
MLLVPFKQHDKRNVKEELNILLQKGFSRLYINSAVVRIEDLLEDEKKNILKKTDTVYLLVDRLIAKKFEEDELHRISDSVNTSFYEGEGEMYLEINQQQLVPFSNKFELDGIQFEEPVPNLFSFNNPYGACPVCEGFSQILGIDQT